MDTDGRHLLSRTDDQWDAEIRVDAELYDQAEQVAKELRRRRDRTIHEALLAGHPQVKAHRASGLSRGRIAQLSTRKFR
jgi:predicted transcriptional regulator